MFITPGSIGTVTITGEVQTVQKGANNIQDQPALTIGTTPTAVVTANSDVCRAIFRAAIGNTEAIYLGSATITNPLTTEAGYPLEPGEPIELLCSDAIFGISANGGQLLYRLLLREQ